MSELFELKNIAYYGYGFLFNYSWV